MPGPDLTIWLLDHRYYLFRIHGCYLPHCIPYITRLGPPHCHCIRLLLPIIYYRYSTFVTCCYSLCYSIYICWTYIDRYHSSPRYTYIYSLYIYSHYGSVVLTIYVIYVTDTFILLIYLNRTLHVTVGMQTSQWANKASRLRRRHRHSIAISRGVT